MRRRDLIAAFLSCAGLSRAQDAQQTIKDIYSSMFARMRDIRTKADLERLIDSIDAPEWVGNMPAGETLTREDTVKDGESALAMPPEKRPIPKMQIAWMRETGWNVQVVYWRYWEAGRQTMGALYRDSWVRTPVGWRRIRTEKFFPDLVLVENGKGTFLPGPE